MIFKKNNRANRRNKLPSWLPVWLDLPLKICFKLSLASLILLLLVAAYYSYLAKGYDMAEVANLPSRTVVLDKNGEHYANLKGNKRRLITYDEIPNHLKHALFAREDEDFETHSGVKLTGLARAAVKNAFAGKYLQGGSTLSMQLIKNTYDNRKKTIHRKLLEIALTYRLEINYEKTEILTHYLNRIYFGAGCYGIEEASITYFGKPTSALHEGESALLVGIIRGPELFNPFKNPDKALEQRNQVIQRMITSGSLTKDQGEIILKKPIRFEKKQSASKHSSYTLQLVRRHLKEILTPAQLDTGGFTIHTTIDPQLVTTLDTWAGKADIFQENALQSAGVILDSQTGAIRAINGGRDVSKFQWNIALDSKRKISAAFNPLLYLATVHYNEVPIIDDPLASGRQIGTDRIARFIKLLGLNDNPEESINLYQGDLRSSPLKLATAYSIFANQGHLPHTYIIKSITDAKGTEIYTAPEKKDELVASHNVISVLDMLTQPDHPLRVFSTSENREDAWGVSVSPALSSVLWTGRNDGKKISHSSESLKKAHHLQLDKIDSQQE